MREPDYIVIRPATNLPPGFLSPHEDGRWYDASTMPEMVLGPLAPGETRAVAVPTGRFEVRDHDGAVAEVWEVQPPA
ncbi:hypothetical protein [Streptomyces sp. Inha503]|uniref:hypothetical protein n=1 Tax=Streptomyces sp. Inha503 TaxID=3383314 RepID=UPI0039A07F62